MVLSLGLHSVASHLGLYCCGPKFGTAFCSGSSGAILLWF